MSHEPVVLLTGASSGLGPAIARLLLQRQYRLVLTARESSLPRFRSQGLYPSSRVLILPMDVTRPSEREAVVEEANQRVGPIDILINNAGVSYRSVVEHVSEQERLAQMNINFRSPMELIRLLLPRMRKRRSGRIINISSVGGMMAMPTMAAYSASKFAPRGRQRSLVV